MRALVLLCVGVLPAVAWGSWVGSVWAGVAVGALVGSGLALSLGLPRERRGALALPSWQAAVGAVLLGLGGGAVLFPATFFDPTWVLWDLETVGERDGVILHTDIPDRTADAELLSFLGALRGTLAERVYDPGPSSCTVHVYLVRNGALYDRLQPFGARGFGYYRARTLRGPTVVVPAHAGAGSLTHHLAYHHLTCGNDAVPQFARVGAATFLEKFVAAHSDNGTWRIGLGYRHTWREPAILEELPAVTLPALFRNPNDQNMQRAFFLFLHHQGWLRPFMAQLQAGKPVDDALFVAVTGHDPRAVEQQFKAWYPREGAQQPQLEGSTVLARQPPTLQWNPTRGMWVSNTGPSVAIGYLPGVL